MKNINTPHTNPKDLEALPDKGPWVAGWGNQELGIYPETLMNTIMDTRGKEQEAIMNKQDKAAFHAAWEKALQENDLLVDRDDFEAGWDAALAHRDSQPMVRLADEDAVKIARKHVCGGLEFDCEDDFLNFINELYTELEAKNRGQG